MLLQNFGRTLGGCFNVGTRFSFACVLFLGVLLFGLAGCNVGPKPGGQPAAFWENVRPAAGETQRLQRNARFWKQAGRLHLALKELEEAHRRDPENLKIVDALALCWEELQDWQRVEELYRGVLAGDPGHPALVNNLCFAYYRAGRLNEAEACFRQNLKYHPDDTIARNNLGLVLTRQGRQEEALSLWRAAQGEAESRRLLHQALAALGKQPAPVAGLPKTGSGHKVTTTAAQALGAVGIAAGARPEVHRQTAAPPSPPVAASVSQVRNVNGNASLDPKTAPAGQAEPDAAPAAGQSGPIEVQVAAAGQVKGNHFSGQDKAPAGLTPLIPRPATPVPAAFPQPAGRLPILKAEELLNTKVEILNGNGITDLARRHRSSLHLEGFDTVAIGNHRDFGQSETAIIYSPQATRVAQVLGGKFFPTANLTMNPQLGENVEVRVILGRDILQKKDVLAKLAD